MNCGNEEHVLRDDEMTNTDGADHEEAPSDADVVMLGVVTSSVVLTSRCHSRTSKHCVMAKDG
jgi:hypothetical protein